MASLFIAFYIDELIDIDNNQELHIFYCILIFLIKPKRKVHKVYAVSRSTLTFYPGPLEMSITHLKHYGDYFKCH